MVKSRGTKAWLYTHFALLLSAAVLAGRLQWGSVSVANVHALAQYCMCAGPACE